MATPAPNATVDSLPVPPSARIRKPRRLPRNHRRNPAPITNNRPCARSASRLSAKYPAISPRGSLALTGPRSKATAAAPTRSAPYPLAAPHRSHLVSFMTPPFHVTAATLTLSPQEARAKRRAARGEGAQRRWVEPEALRLFRWE